MAVNDAGSYIPKIAHWFSCHAEWFAAWGMVRAIRYPMDGIVYHSKQGNGGDVEWPITGEAAPLGGHAAAIVALCLYDDVTLAGIPADDGGHFYPTEIERGWDGAFNHGQSSYLNAWLRIQDWSGGRLSSLSGNTRKVLCP